MAEYKDVQEFWNSRANLGDAAGSQDLILKQLEIRAISSYVQDGMKILDMGCGNGITAIEIARNYHVSVVGVDYAEDMIVHANILAKGQDLRGSVKFYVGDIRTVGLKGKFDLIYTERMLINLQDWKVQHQAIIDIVSLLDDGGKYVMCENSQDGLDELNLLRDNVGLPKITPPWHNRYIRDKEIKTIKEAKLVEMNYFSSTYYFLSRVVNAWQASQEGKEPSYQAPINKLSLQLPSISKSGQGRIWVWKSK